MRCACSSLFALAVAAAPVSAHDVWLQANTAVVRTGDAVHIDLMLGNHGNDHRDFKLASKVSPETLAEVAVRGPDGKRFDLKPDLIDLGLAPKEAFHSAKFVTSKPGVYVAYQTADGVVKHGSPVRSVRSGKTYFAASDSLDRVPKDWAGFDAPLGHALELVPESNPVAPVGPGQPIRVRLLFGGKPLPGVKVSFVPRGTTLREGTDPEYERTTDAAGRASFAPRTGQYHLIVAHHATPDKGDGYDATKYTATLCVLVPEKCPCCGD